MIFQMVWIFVSELYFDWFQGLSLCISDPRILINFNKSTFITAWHDGFVFDMKYIISKGNIYWLDEELVGFNGGLSLQHLRICTWKLLHRRFVWRTQTDSTWWFRSPLLWRKCIHIKAGRPTISVSADRHYNSSYAALRLSAGDSFSGNEISCKKTTCKGVHWNNVVEWAMAPKLSPLYSSEAASCPHTIPFQVKLHIFMVRAARCFSLGKHDDLTAW